MDAGEEMCKEGEADYYYEDHVDNVWSIIISVLNGGGGERRDWDWAQLQPEKCSIHYLHALSVAGGQRRAVCMGGVELNG